MTRFHEWALDRFGVLIWIPPIVVAASLVYYLSEVLDIPRLSVWWGSAWTPTFFADAWNALDGFLDWRANKNANPPVRPAQVAAARWSMRNDAMLSLESFAMAVAGFTSIFQWTILGLAPGPLAAALIFAAAADRLAVALWNRSDRWAVLRIGSRSRLGIRRA